MSPRPLLLAGLFLASAAGAQVQSDSYKFLEAVRAGNGNEVIAMVERPGSRVINARDITSGEGALHVVVKRGDATYLRYLLQKGADPNLRDGKGMTPLLLAVMGGQGELVPLLVKGKANVNLGNGSGETPLILAVQRRDLDMVRTLLAAGADPDQTDNLAGLSARDYARRNARNPALAKLLEEAPKRSSRGAAGPRL